MINYPKEKQKTDENPWEPYDFWAWLHSDKKSPSLFLDTRVIATPWHATPTKTSPPRKCMT